MIRILNIIKKFLMCSPCITCKTTNTLPFYNICVSCSNHLSLVKNQEKICPRCHDTWFQQDICQNCKNMHIYWDHLITIFSYKDTTMKTLFYRYKFKNSLPAEKDLTSLLKDYLIPYQHYHIIIIPCGEDTKKRLGFNPVLKILKNLRFSYNTPLKKRKNTLSSKFLSGNNRKKQQNTIFCTQPLDKEILQKKILLVDDIFTTGSTLNQAAYILRKQGCNHITCLCFLRS